MPQPASENASLTRWTERAPLADGEQAPARRLRHSGRASRRGPIHRVDPTPHEPTGVTVRVSLVTTPAQVLAAMLASDSARPRVTFYDDAPGPAHGERIDLSARVLANWVSKAGNALQEELDAGPGTTLALCMPLHWRALYWALAGWSVGATLVLPTGPDAAARPAHAADVLVTDDQALASAADEASRRAVLVSLPMLARSHTGTVAGVMDEARELSTYGDVFDAWDQPAADDPALRVTGSGGEPDAGTVDTAYAAVVVDRPEWGAAPRVNLVGPLERALTDALSAWALGGSVVVVREPAGDQRARLATEGVTLDLAAAERSG